MTPEIALVLTILAAAVVFLITEWIPMEVTALLSLGAVALTGLVTPVEALAGFSNPAVVTVWAVFILSGGLTLTGVANVIGSFVLRLAGSGERGEDAQCDGRKGKREEGALGHRLATSFLMIPGARTDRGARF